MTQQAGKRPLRMLRLSALVAQVLEKIFDQGLHKGGGLDVPGSSGLSDLPAGGNDARG